MPYFKTPFRKIMNHSPLWLRKAITRAIVRNLTAHIMPDAEAMKCENDPIYRDKTVAKYMKKYPKQTKIMKGRMKDLFSTNPKYTNLSKEERRPIIKDMCFYWFGYGFRPHEYVFLDLGNRNHNADNRRLMVSDTERVAFRFCANDFSNSVYADKASAYEALRDYYKRDAVVIKGEKDRDKFKAFIQDKSQFVQKLVNSSRGNGVLLIKLSDYPSTDTYFDSIVNKGKLLLEEVIVQSPDFARFNKDSVNTVRLYTYYTRHGIIAPFGYLRTGRIGSFIDNCAAGGVFSAIDCERGIVATKSCDEFGNRYELHPDSGLQLKGFHLPEWEKAVNLCKSAAALTPDLKYLGWDLAYSEKHGWVIVEVNTSGQFMSQAPSLVGMRPRLKPIIDDMDLLIPFTIRG